MADGGCETNGVDMRDGTVAQTNAGELEKTHIYAFGVRLSHTLNYV